MKDAGQLLTWRRQGQSFGLALERCREVKEGASLFRLPLAPTYVAGVCNLRGDVVTVIDLPRFVGEQWPATAADALDDARSAIVRIKHPDHHIAILADELTDILEVAADAWEPPPRNLTELQLSVIGAVVRRAAELVSVLRPEGLLIVRGEQTHGVGSTPGAGSTPNAGTTRADQAG